MWLAYVVSHICYNARACASTCVRAQYPFVMTWRGSPNAFGGGRCPLFTKRIALQTRLRHFRNLTVLSSRAAVAAHEKHRPSGVRTRRRQSPLIAMYSKLCPTETAPPVGGAGSRGVKYYQIIVIF